MPVEGEAQLLGDHSDAAVVSVGRFARKTTVPAGARLKATFLHGI